jgi:hypothetical protein
LDAHPLCITEIINHGFISDKVFDDLEIPKDKARTDMDRNWTIMVRVMFSVEQWKFLKKEH